MGSRYEEQCEQVLIETCDSCGKDIPEPYPGDSRGRVCTRCSFCKKLLCRDCAKSHHVLIDSSFSGVEACPTCWKAGAEERAALDELNKMALAKLKEHRAAWQKKAEAAAKPTGKVATPDTKLVALLRSRVESIPEDKSSVWVEVTDAAEVSSIAPSDMKKVLHRPGVKALLEKAGIGCSFRGDAIYVYKADPSQKEES